LKHIERENPYTQHLLIYGSSSRAEGIMMKRKKIAQKIVAKPTEAYGLLKTSLKYQTKEFFDSSTLHGVRYIAEKGRPFSEKFMWFCLVAVGAVAAFVIIGSLWEVKLFKFYE
jgi:hypothetical protein